MTSPKNVDGGAPNSEVGRFRQAYGVLRQTPRVIALFWRAWPLGAVLMVTLALATAPLPALGLYCGKRVIDGVVLWLAGDADAARGIVVLYLALAGGLILLQHAADSLEFFLHWLFDRRLRHHIESQIAARACSLEIGFFETPSFYDKLERAQRASGGRAWDVLNALLYLVQETARMGSYLFVLVLLSWWTVPFLLVITLPGLILRAKYGHLGWFIEWGRTSEARRMRYYRSQLTDRTKVKELRLFGLSEHFTDLWKDFFWRFYRQDRKRTGKQYLTQFSDTALRGMGYVGFYVYAVFRIVTDVPRGTVGSLVMYTQAMERSISSVAMILQSIATMYENNLYMNDLFDYLAIEPKLVAPAEPIVVPEPIRQGIRFESVGFHYPESSQNVLQEITLDIRPGERVALVGENGAGKTTLIKLFSRLYDPQQGRITVDGIDLRQFDPKAWQQQIGIIFQDFAQYSVTARENVGFGQLDYVDDLPRIRAAAGFSGAAERIERFEKGWETVLGKEFDEGQELSVGEWQKVALARAFIREAQILVLDEPTASLDAKQEHLIYQQFNELTQGKTTILISHRFSTVRMVDRIFVIEHGRISESGSHEELMVLGGRYADLFTRQASAYR